MGYYVPNKVKPVCYNCPYRTNKYCGLLTEHDYLGDYPLSYEEYPHCPLVEVKDEPQRDCTECKYVWWNSDMKRYECSISRCPYNEQTEPNNSEKPNNCENCKHHFGKDYYDIECEAKAFGNECRYEPKDEPQTNADQHVQHVGSVESVEPTWTKEEHEAFYTFLWNVINPNEMQDYIEMFETKDEPQKWEKPPKFEHKGIQTACVSVPMSLIEDEPQTEDWHTWRDEQEYNDRWQTERSE